MTAAIILAAGAGRRMGGPKALLPYEGETLLRRAARVALEAGCSPVIAVVGDWNPGLEDLAVLPVINPEAAEGMASSIRAGIAALPPEAPAVLVLTVDQPAVDVALLRRLIALAIADTDRPAACAYAGTLGIPAVLPRRCFPELLALRGDAGAKAILLREAARSLPFPEGAHDLDSPEDLPPDSVRR
ncbi:nucleotidyltransferase family protein [Geothrix mesophila]|uniref:nucleotidyltransferase family protein n=1 Tax=Geothrix mesophila TaxID=2922723 RepID=UPI001FADD9C5